VVASIEPGLLEGIDVSEETAVLAIIEATFRQAADLLERPARPPGWTYEDPVVLEAQGQASRIIVRAINALAERRPQLAAALHRPAAFLDIGTGVGRLAIQAARTWPALRVIGIDPWEPALGLARRYVSESDAKERIDVRRQGVEQLQDTAESTLAWLPAPFIPAEVVIASLERINRALMPGGWPIAGLYSSDSIPLATALTQLCTVRSGGYPWTASEIEERLRAAGFEAVEAVSPAPSILFVLGRRPDAQSHPGGRHAPESRTSEAGSLKPTARVAPRFA
jgi:SAM-dependent methyltransferase